MVLLINSIHTNKTTHYLGIFVDNHKNKDLIIKNTMKSNKKVIRLTESRLKRMIAESVKQVLREEGRPGTLIH